MDADTNPYAGLSHAELLGRRKDFARLKDAGIHARKAAERNLDLIGKALLNPGPRRGVEVSDHAILRYLERVKGFDIEAMRVEICDAVRTGHQVASERIRGKGKEIYVVNGEGYVTTVLPASALISSIRIARKERAA